MRRFSTFIALFLAAALLFAGSGVAPAFSAAKIGVVLIRQTGDG
jgi:hypothetical protein